MLAELERDGFSLRRSLAPRISTIEVAQALGTVIDVEGLLPSSGIPTVQSLRPRKTSDVGPNQYSGHYGLGTFPVHTDLAHWALPPRYLLLRCVVGSDDVFAHVLPWTPIVGMVGAATLRKVVFAARRRRIGYSGLVRAMSHRDGSEILRWARFSLHRSILKELLRDFNKELCDFCAIHCARRNAELHSGEEAFAGLGTSAWLPKFYATCEVFLRSMGKNLGDFFRDPGSVQTTIAALRDTAAKAVAQEIETHKKIWNAKSPNDQKLAHEQAIVWATRHSGHRVACPAWTVQP